MKLESLWITAIIMIAKSGTTAPTHLVDEAPISITKLGSDSFLIDFGRVAFGNLRIESAHSVDQPITVHFGEALGEGRINRKPPGTVRYATIEAKLNPREFARIGNPLSLGVVARLGRMVKLSSRGQNAQFPGAQRGQRPRRRLPSGRSIFHKKCKESQWKRFED